MAIEIRSNDGNYKTRAYDFKLASDLYLLFKFESPNSDCEIAIAYDEYVDGGDWYVNDGELDEDDDEIVNDVVFSKLPMTLEFTEFETAVNAAVSKFNKS